MLPDLFPTSRLMVPDPHPTPRVTNLGTLDADALGFKPTPMGDILIDQAISSVSLVAIIGIAVLMAIGAIFYFGGSWQ